MNSTPRTYKQLEQNVAAWAQRQPKLHAVIVVGSRARTDHPADEWSDLDLILFTTDPAPYSSRYDWLTEIGDVWLAHLNYTGRGDPEGLVLSADGLKADFVLVAAAGSLQQMIDRSPYQFVIQRLIRVLVEKSSIPTPLMLSEPQPTPLPTSDQFHAAVQSFLWSAVRVGRELKRGELWPAKAPCDCALKERLLKMLEWHTQADHGPKRDTWHGGRFLEEWADPRAVASLADTFSTYDTADVGRALFATLGLFRWLALETSSRLGIDYPATADQHVTEWLQSLFAGE